jgi:prepilin-type N-terminal cleavage/methylation domain-containing protein
MKKTTSGFTIVELLIVIVVIGVLAAIVIVAYNGIQQRANNTAIISAANQSVKVIQAYHAAKDDYPYTGSGNACITIVSGCVRDTGVVDNSNATFNNNIASIGTQPTSVPVVGTVANGIMYNYTPTRTFNGQAQPAMIFYWLNGLSQQCGLSNVMNTWDTAVTATNGYTAGSSGGKTLCYISIPG